MPILPGEDGRVLEADCPWATQAMANAILAKVEGYCYQGAVVDYAEITPAAELGDTVVCDGVAFSLAQSSVTFDGAYAPTISAPADEEVDYEYRYQSETERQLNRKVTLGESYYGFKTSRENGIEVVNIVDGVETTRMILNSSVQAFYNADGEAALYFDAVAGKYKFKGDVTITDGSLVLSSAFAIFPSDITEAEIEAITVPDGFNLYHRYQDDSIGNVFRLFVSSDPGNPIVFTSNSANEAELDFMSTRVGGDFYVLDNVYICTRGGYAYYQNGAYSGADAEIATVGKVKDLITNGW